MVYDISGKSAPLAQSQQSLVACSLLNCGSQSKRLSRCQGHSVSRGVQHKVFCDGLQDKQYSHYHSLPHTFGRYNYPFQGQLLQRLNILDFGNPFVVQVLSHPSSLGAYRQSKYAEVGAVLCPKPVSLPVSSPLLLQAVSCPLKHQLFSAWFFPCISVSYLYYNIHQEIVQWN